jgi:hypothetical protein
MNQGFVVSNDHFADHVRSLPEGETARQATEWLEKFRCPYTFIKKGKEQGVFMPSPASTMMGLLEKYRRGEGDDRVGGGGQAEGGAEDEMEMDTII